MLYSDVFPFPSLNQNPGRAYQNTFPAFGAGVMVDEDGNGICFHAGDLAEIRPIIPQAQYFSCGFPDIDMKNGTIEVPFRQRDFGELFYGGGQMRMGIDTPDFSKVNDPGKDQCDDFSQRHCQPDAPDPQHGG